MRKGSDYFIEAYGTEENIVGSVREWNWGNTEERQPGT